MARNRRRGGAAAVAAALALGVASESGGAPAAANGTTPVDTAPAAASTSTFTLPTITLGTAMFRDFANLVALPETNLLSKLPDVRLRIDLGRNDWIRGDPSLQAITGVEVEVPRIPGVWLGVEDPASSDESPRATLSIQKSF